MLSASFKAFSGWKAVHNVRDCLSISPISFLKMSGLPIIYGSVVPYVTYEGDNSVLTQQTARFLLKELQKLQNVNILRYFGLFNEFIGKREISSLYKFL